MTEIPVSFGNIKPGENGRTAAVIAVPLASLEASIGEGQLVSARVVKLLGENKGIIEINGQRLVAELKTPLAEGQEMLLEAKGLQDGRLVLQILATGEKAAAQIAHQDAFSSILTKAGLQTSGQNLQILSFLMEEQAQITAPLLKDISRALLAAGKLDSLSIRSAVFLAVRNMPLTAENIRLASLVLQAGGLGEVLAKVLVEQLGQSQVQPQSTATGQSTEQPQAALGKMAVEPTTGSPAGASASKIVPITVQTTSTVPQTAGTVQTTGTTQTTVAMQSGAVSPTPETTAAPVSAQPRPQPIASHPGQLAPVPDGSASVIPGSVADQPTMGIQAGTGRSGDTGQAVPTPQDPRTEPTTPTVQTTPTAQTMPSTQTAQPANQSAQQPVQGTANPQPALPSAQQSATRSQTGATVTTSPVPEPPVPAFSPPLLSQDLQNFLADTLKKLLLVKVGQEETAQPGGLTEVLEKQLVTSGQSFQASDLLAKLVDRLAIQQPGQQTSQQPLPENFRLDREAEHTSQNNLIPFDPAQLRDIFGARQVVQNAIRQNEAAFLAYVPVPIQWEGSKAGGELYVWKRQGKEEENSDGFHVLFLLQTPNFGGWRIDLVSRGENLSINIGVEKKEVQQLVNTNLESLRMKVEAQGFKINHLNCNIKDPSHQVNDVGEKTMGTIGTEGLDITV